MKRLPNNGFWDRVLGPAFDSIAYGLIKERDDLLFAIAYMQTLHTDCTQEREDLRNLEQSFWYKVLPPRHLDKYENLRARHLHLSNPTSSQPY